MDIITLKLSEKYADKKIAEASGLGDKSFTFRQSTPSDVWEIEHPLNKFPSVSVVDSGDNAIVGEVTYVNSGKIIITFTAPFSGKAYLN